MNWFGNTSKATRLAVWRSPPRPISKPRSVHPCANCRTTRKRSAPSTKNHPSDTPHNRALTYGLINKLAPFERSRALAITPDAAGLVLGADFRLRAFDRSGQVQWNKQTPGTAWGVNVTGDG